jgi:hypothetical protein
MAGHVQRDLLPWRHGLVAAHNHDTSNHFFNRSGVVPRQGSLPKEDGAQEPAGTVYADKARWLHRRAGALRDPGSQFWSERAFSLLDESATSGDASFDLLSHLSPDAIGARRRKHVHLRRRSPENGRNEENLSGLLVDLHLDFEPITRRELQGTKINALCAIARFGEIPRTMRAADYLRDRLIGSHDNGISLRDDGCCLTTKCHEVSSQVSI